MKNVLKTLLVALTVVSFVACSDDDSNQINATIQNVAATVTAQNSMTAEEDATNITVSLDQSFASDASVRVVFEFENGNILNQTFTIAAGNTSTTESFQLPADDGNFYDNPVVAPMGGKAWAAGVVLADPIVGTQLEIASNELYFDVANKVAAVQDNDGFQFLFDWTSGGTNDIDLYLYDHDLGWPAGYVDGSFTGSRFETISATSAIPDGNYAVLANVWSLANSPSDIAYAFTYRAPDGTLASSAGTWVGAADGSDLFPMNDVIVTKSTDGSGVVTWTMN